MAKKARKLGRLNISEMRNLINKKAGTEVAFDLTKDNPTQVKDWIPTGSRWLDSVVCRGHLAGIPVGKISEYYGNASTAKTVFLTHILKDAQKKGFYTMLVDSENAYSADFATTLGLDPDKLIYCAPETLEDCF